MNVIPNAPEIEKSILSKALSNAESNVDYFVSEGITEDYFYVPAHRLIWQLIMARVNSGAPVDAVGISNDLTQSGDLEKVGGMPGLMDIVGYTTYDATRNRDMAELKSVYTLRKIYETSMKLAQAALEGKTQAADILDAAEREMLAIRTDLMPENPITFANSVQSVLNRLEDGIKRKGAPDGLCTGFGDLDRKTGGLHGGEFFVVAARPSMGKTALMLNIMQHIVNNDEAEVLIFSFEMTQTALAERLFFTACGIGKSRICDEQGRIPRENMGAIKSGFKWLKSRHIIIRDIGDTTIGAVRAYARRIKKQHPKLAAIGVDYLQLMRSNSAQAKNSREREISEISSGLKALAKELNIPIICLSQLNRAVENRSGKDKGVPMMSDLRDSGSIEQDADLIGLLYRPAYYMREDDPNRETFANLAFLDLAKNRNGVTGRVSLYFEPEIMRFSQAELRYDDEPEPNFPAA